MKLNAILKRMDADRPLTLEEMFVRDHKILLSEAERLHGLIYGLWKFETISPAFTHLQSGLIEHILTEESEFYGLIWKGNPLREVAAELARLRVEVFGCLGKMELALHIYDLFRFRLALEDLIRVLRTLASIEEKNASALLR